MSDPIEQELRAAFASKVVSVSPAVGQRLRTADYRPRKRRLPAFAGFGALGASLAAAAVAAVVLLSSGTPAAFAGWTAVPTAPSPAAIKVARAACGSVTSADVLAADQRGPYTAIVFQRGSKPTECVTEGRRVLLSQATLYPPRMFVSPGAGNVTLPIPSPRWWTHPRRRLTAVSGTVGPGVTRVTLRLANGTSVAATVGHGWYLAWWPGSFADHAYPTTMIVSTAAGTHRAPYSASRLHALFAGCRLGTRCRAFEQAIQGFIDLVPSLPPQLTKHYRLFREAAPPTTPTKLIRQRNLLPPQNIQDMGLDLAQIRTFRLGHSVTLFVVPGSAGVCLALVVGDGGSVSCPQSSSVWQQGTISLAGGFTFHGVTAYYVIALVPDANHTVTVRLSNGRTVVLPVKHNVVLHGFPVEPTQITYRNAAGKATKYG
jgi:hypothetical protein